jgi:hypothetical protein
MTYRPLLIGLVGRAGAGKTTVANHLEAEWAFESIAFADPILAMALALFDDAGVGAEWAVERALKDQPVPTLGVSYRRIAQTLGTAWGRQTIGDDLWLRVAASKLQRARLHQASVVISDVRFPNEAQWLLEQGGLLVRVTRPDLPPLPADAASHPSEHYAERLPVHEVLLNGASITTLCDRVDDLVRSLRAHA